MGLFSEVRWLLNKIHLDVVRFDRRWHPLARRMSLIETHGIDLIFDVGANIGQYANQVRQYGFRGQIVSFEPLTAAFEELQERALSHPNWTAVKLALGSNRGELPLNIAGNSQSSSLLPMLDRHREAAPESAYVGTETVSVETLESIFSAYTKPHHRPFLKIDTQGSEKDILEGAGAVLKQVVGLQVEMSLVPLYAGEWSMTQMIEYLDEKGFTLMSLEPVYSDPKTGQLLQVDGIFFRPSSHSN